MELSVIENLLKIILSVVLWASIGQVILLGVIYIKLRAIPSIVGLKNEAKNR